MKFLISPFVWYLLTVLIGLLLLRPSTDGSRRRIANGLILLTLLLAAASTQLVGILIERSLRVDRVSVSGSTPEFIIVLGGGYAYEGGYTSSSSVEEQVLSTTGAQRLRHAVKEWRSNTNARLILSGASDPPRPTVAELMARAAARYGVPDSVLILEQVSHNTREHPVEALRLPGVTSTTHVAVVTSGWHMRRARGEFCRYFERLDVYPAPPIERDGVLGKVVPQAGRLGWNTLLLREWVGIVWYAIRGIGVEAVGDC